MGDQGDDLGEKADELGRRADNSDTVDHAVRFGLVVYGLVYLLVAWLIVQLALGERRGSVSTKGALKEVAEQPFGDVLLVVVAAGMVVLVLWRLLDLFVGHRDEEGADLWRGRGADLLKSAIYGFLGWKAFGLATESSSSGGTKVLTARIMDLPMGRVLVGAIGLAIVGYGVANLWKGLSNKHREHLAHEGRSGNAGSAYLLLGKVGYVSKGLVVGLVGALFVYAAITHEPKDSSGVDGAVREILHQPFGTPLLVAVGLGIASYGLFALARARHLSR
ncbi:DUF1206 domain-containing protein [Nocardioides sp. Soil796]|uniref:DUF1206 domain-containing protein n=1 Tax=Nocardioides sp. Soil796 TaxID=1736412 RepID=UPI000710A0E5|nr:DUF1206 domain-containing protein [Nocardioides sp. Soil796]KRF16265.1 hypothetical protein ASH02_06725 [Nocardioides sp. Soil796]